MNEISLKEFFVLPKNSYELIDIRDQGLILYGSIPGASHISLEELEDGNCGKIKDIPKEKKLIFYCQIGRRSKELGSLACLAGKECFSLEGGYVGYVMSSMRSSFEQEKRKQKAEESIRNRFHEKLFSPFAKACKTYQLISEGDHIGVCISGGKDSMLMAKLFQEIHRHRKVRKDEIRVLSKEMGLDTWNKQSFACLSSRFVYGETISEEKLRMVDHAEQLLLDLGFHQVRVCVHGNIARIEVLPEEFEKLVHEHVRNRVYREMKAIGFSYVTMDLGGYRTGSMNETL